MRERLLSPHTPVADRMRTIFGLQGVGTDGAVDILCEALLNDDETSVLVKHELAYVLGQMRNHRANATLKRVLGSRTENSMVRHECAEALGAIATDDVAAALEVYAGDPTEAPEVRETCQLALARVRWLRARDPESLDRPTDTRGSGIDPVFLSVDPAPPLPVTPASPSVQALRAMLLDARAPLFSRYQAMFSLRNLNTDESALALCDGLLLDRSSALFRHEIAFIMGQTCRECTLPALTTALNDPCEHPMVRHEAAEAIGAIGTPAATRLLQQRRADAERVVRESCEVALDIAEHVTSDETHYADVLCPLKATASSATEALHL